MSALTAIDDGLTAYNYNLADIFLLVGTALALFAAFAYGWTTTPRSPDAPAAGWRHWAAALLAFAVACTAFALFLL